VPMTGSDPLLRGQSFLRTEPSMVRMLVLLLITLDPSLCWRRRSSDVFNAVCDVIVQLSAQDIFALQVQQSNVIPCLVFGSEMHPQSPSSTRCVDALHAVCDHPSVGLTYQVERWVYAGCVKGRAECVLAKLPLSILHYIVALACPRCALRLVASQSAWNYHRQESLRIRAAQASSGAGMLMGGPS
jgi:hypothetical protein